MFCAKKLKLKLPHTSGGSLSLSRGQPSILSPRKDHSHPVCACPTYSQNTLPLLIMVSWPTPLMEAFYPIKGQAGILIPRGRPVSRTLETSSTPWKPGKGLLSYQKAAQHLKPRVPLARSKVTHICSQKFSPNWGSKPLLYQRPPRPSEVQPPVWAETLYSNTGHDIQKTRGERETKEENTHPIKTNQKIGTLTYNHYISWCLNYKL